MIALYIVLGLLLVFFLMGMIFYRLALRRKGKNYSAPKGIKLSGAEEAHEWLMAHQTGETDIVSRDGLKLHARLVLCRGSHQFVIACHGYGGSSSMMAQTARIYYERGYSVLMPDARGHGESDGSTICMGWHERLDVVEWANYLVKEYNPEEILLTGISMGGATVMNASGEALPPCVHGIIDDCGFVSIRDEFIYQLHRFYHLPAYPFLIPASILCHIAAGYGLLRDGDTCAQLKKSHIPILIIHGDADNFVPTEHGRRAYAAASAPKRLLIVPKAGHALALNTDPDLYTASIDAFLREIHA